MNRYKEAKAWIDKVNAHHEWARHDFEEPALSQLTELVEKATPKKALEVYESFLDLDLFGECPVCGEWCSSTMNYCPKCGQALDWKIEVKEDVD